MERINQNELARIITLSEGKRESVSIAQVKEVIKLTLDKLATYPDEVILELIERHRT